MGCSCSRVPQADPADINNLLYDDYEEPTLAEIAADDKIEETTKTPTFNSDADVFKYMNSSPDSSLYVQGIMAKIAEADYHYAHKLMNSVHKRFIIVDKGSMTVRLYDSYGREQKSYKMACAKNYGHKQSKADSRTPEGFFSVYKTYDSTEWLFTDDNGVTSDVKGQFGPRFIRLLIPGTSQIGIHGTCAPWSLGGRRSHGCIRISNDDILELVELVDSGMPVIVNPGPKDVIVNEDEGREIPYIDFKGDMEKRIQQHRDAMAQKAYNDSVAADSIKRANTPVITVDVDSVIVECTTI